VDEASPSHGDALKIAIQPKTGPAGESFCERWIAYCQQQALDYRIVDCYRSDIIQQVAGCDAFFWHHHHWNYRDALFAKSLLYSLEIAGLSVFPDFRTNWHFDDKLGQKYLLEAIGAPLVKSYAFFSKPDALAWIETVQFPKVFKLRGGAGARNVWLVPGRRQATTLVRRAFGGGFSQYDKWGQLRERIRRCREGLESPLGIPKAIARLVIQPEFARMHGRERGYAYFQDFIPNNAFDIRVVVVGDRAFALKRAVRKGDFRASGSGYISYDPTDIDEECVRVALETNRRLQTQSIAYDFVLGESGEPLIVEISYAYAVKSYDPCPGYWDGQLRWHPGPFNPQEWMIEDLLARTVARRATPELPTVEDDTSTHES